MLIKIPASGADVVTQYISTVSITRVYVISNTDVTEYTVRITAGSDRDIATFENRSDADVLALSIAVALGLDWEYPA
jgi:hypothetical protein